MVSEQESGSASTAWDRLSVLQYHMLLLWVFGRMAIPHWPVGSSYSSSLVGPKIRFENKNQYLLYRWLDRTTFHSLFPTGPRFSRNSLVPQPRRKGPSPRAHPLKPTRRRQQTLQALPSNRRSQRSLHLALFHLRRNSPNSQRRPHELQKHHPPRIRSLQREISPLWCSFWCSSNRVYDFDKLYGG